MKHISYLSLAVLLFSCNGSETAAGTTLQAELNETITIEMKSNATTGYQWHLVRRSPLVDSLDSEYHSDFGAGCSNGAGGMETWKFKAVKKGIDTLGFVYARDLKEDQDHQSAQRTYIVDIK